MNDGKWFSTKLRFAVMVEPVGADTLNDCVFMLKAADFGAAFDSAMSIGQTSEKEYRNAEGQLVRWKFKEIVSLDIILAENLDGREVYSEPTHLDEKNRIPYDNVFNPETSKPLQTI